jgi:hypothetical protein
VRSQWSVCGAKNTMQDCDLVLVCGWLGRAPVLVDQSAEYSMTSDRGVGGITAAGSLVGVRWLSP